MFIDFKTYGNGFLDFDLMYKRIDAGEKFVLAMNSVSEY